MQKFEIPKSCNEAYYTTIGNTTFWYKCPCKIEGNMDGPTRCTLRELQTHDPFNSTPDYSKCPLRK